MSTRIVAGAIFLIAAAYLFAARGYQANFGDVLGPSAFPTIVGVPALVLSGLIALFPGGDVTWPERGRLLRQLSAVAILIGYALLLQPLGFPVATGFLIALMTWLMGGHARSSMLLGVSAAPGLWLLFDRVLGLPLDLLGHWFRP